MHVVRRGRQRCTNNGPTVPLMRPLPDTSVRTGRLGLSLAGLQPAAEGLSGDDSARQSCLGEGPVSHGFEQIIGASDTRRQ